MSLSRLPGPKGSAKSVSQDAYTSPSVTDWNALVAAVDELRGTVSFVVNVKDPAFGAAGDGVTDDYAAFQAAITAFNSSLIGKGKFLIPPGTYLINKYVIDSPDNGIRDFTFSNLDNFVIEGYGAKLDIKGDFNRPADLAIGGGNYVSYSRSIIPLQFSNCKHGTIKGLEIDQNVDQMTRAGSVVEGVGYGIVLTNNCQYLKLEDLNVHHSSTDAISLQAGATYTAVKNITVRNCEFWACARLAGSVIQASNVLFENCGFRASGRTNAAGTAAGSYTGHAPQAGFDIEPDYTPTTSPSVDVLTSNINFHGCRFEACEGALFSSASGAAIGNVTADGCVFDDSNGSGYSISIVMACLNGIIKNSYMDVKAVYVTWFDAGDPTKLKTTIRDNYIRSNNVGIITSGVVQDVTIDGNDIIGYHAVPIDSAHGVLFPYIQSNTKLRFTNNQLFIPAAGYGAASGYFVSSLLNNCALVEGNTYRTDLATPGNFLATGYDLSAIVRNEQYLTPVYWKSDYSAHYDDANYAFNKQPARTEGYVSTTDGTLRCFTGDSTASPGNATLNYFAGKSAIAAAASACTISSVNVAADDVIMITAIDNDATLTRWKAVAASGSFTVTGNAAATATWKFGWFVIKKGN